MQAVGQEDKVQAERDENPYVQFVLSAFCFPPWPVEGRMAVRHATDKHRGRRMMSRATSRYIMRIQMIALYRKPRQYAEGQSATVSRERLCKSLDIVCR